MVVTREVVHGFRRESHSESVSIQLVRAIAVMLDVLISPFSWSDPNLYRPDPLLDRIFPGTCISRRVPGKYGLVHDYVVPALALALPLA